jgi:hypothetical protein
MRTFAQPITENEPSPNSSDGLVSITMPGFVHTGIV